MSWSEILYNTKQNCVIVTYQLRCDASISVMSDFQLPYHDFVCTVHMIIYYNFFEGEVVNFKILKDRSKID